MTKELTQDGCDALTALGIVLVRIRLIAARGSAEDLGVTATEACNAIRALADLVHAVPDEIASEGELRSEYVSKCLQAATALDQSFGTDLQTLLVPSHNPQAPEAEEIGRQRSTPPATLPTFTDSVWLPFFHGSVVPLGFMLVLQLAVLVVVNFAGEFSGPAYQATFAIYGAIAAGAWVFLCYRWLAGRRGTKHQAQTEE